MIVLHSVALVTLWNGRGRCPSVDNLWVDFLSRYHIRSNADHYLPSPVSAYSDSDEVMMESPNSDDIDMIFGCYDAQEPLVKQFWLE